jgi:uncharacterized protein
MLHPDTTIRFVNEDLGWGVFATRLIPRGTITWTRDALDQAPRPDLGAPYRELVSRFGWRDAAGEWLLPWDHARFLNHACAPTTLTAGWDLDIALRDIRPGEELTRDYAAYNHERTFACACGMASCRGEVRPDDVYDQVDRWDEHLAVALPALRTVQQALWDLVREKEQLNAALEERAPIPSIRARLMRFRGQGASSPITMR